MLTCLGSTHAPITEKERCGTAPISESLQTYYTARKNLNRSVEEVEKFGDRECDTQEAKDAEYRQAQCLKTVRQCEDNLTEDDRARIVAENPGHWEEPLSATPPTPNLWREMS